MEKREAADSIGSVNTYLHNLQLNPNSDKTKSTHKSHAPTLQSFDFSFLVKRECPPSLVSLCIGVVGRHLEDIIDDLAEIASTFPSDIKMALVAIARRRKLLNDDIIVALADSSWEIFDISGSDVSDFGLCHVVKLCKNLRAVDISRCSRLTSTGVSELLQNCHSLEILRWGGCPRSDYTARRCSSLLKPNLNDLGGESWEELDVTEFTHGAQSLRWLVWPKIDKDSLESLSVDCPRITINPKSSPLGFRGSEVPREAILQVVLDDPIVKDIDPKTWAVTGFISKTTLASVSSPNELSIAEKFRLAFVERDTRLAPKRAKNARQHRRRSEREWVMTDTRAKALALASKASKSLHPKNS
ncbi:unnamed protein product [Fraxinus pennsylvanica]|uniref:RNI-like superfamily protein n=1 Tax=Fraxinus pennsylvanica TaxID=56036 RepID=A0AAD2AA03_9LAMI|nr:unnamed protein product [Fraxinus pennsylvanica]